MIKIIHAADLHMDSPFEGLTPEQAKMRRAEQRELLERIRIRAENENADLILLAGDLLDSGSTYYETAKMLGEIFAGSCARVFISPGNHDPYTRGGQYSKIAFPENVHIFKSGDIECVLIPELGARVWGAGFAESGSPPLLRGARAEPSEEIIDIMVLHGDVTNLNSDYNPISREDIAQSGMDYIALGHPHSFSGLRREGNVFYAWPGCPEGRGFDECGEKGIIVAEVQKADVSIRFVPIALRKYEAISIDLTGSADHLGAICAALPEDSSRDIYRIRLVGECEETPELTGLEEKLGERFFALQIRDETVPARDIWEKCGEDTLSGLFITRLRRRYDEAEDEEARALVVYALRFGLAALSGMEEPYI